MLEEDIILEAQIDPSPKTQDGISEEGISHYKIIYQFF